MGRSAPFLVIILMLLGCKSRPLGPYVSPRVTGQVLAADTGQPLPGVTVARGNPERYRLPGPPPKGGELLLQKPVVHTDREGRFVLASERILSVIRPAAWNLLELDLRRPGYEHFQTNLPIDLATNSFKGQPLLDAGKIFLQPARSETSAIGAPDSNRAWFGGRTPDRNPGAPATPGSSDRNRLMGNRALRYTKL